MLAASCSKTSAPAGALELCAGKTTPISAVQGGGYYSPLENSEITVGGIVTRVDPDNGFYLEEPADGRAGRESRALFVATDSARVEPGMRIHLSGTVEEIGQRRDKLTTLTGPHSFEQCSKNNQLPLTRADLPLGNPAREALEGMRVSFGPGLVITDTYSMYRGVITLSSSGPQRVPTEEIPPGRQADEAGRRNRENSLLARLPGLGFQPAPAGTALADATGILGHDGRQQILFLDRAVVGDTLLPRIVKPPLPGNIRAVNSNLLNFFNGDGKGTGFPTERGAETRIEFIEQKERTNAAMSAMRPDLLAVQELENDGFGPLSAAASLLAVLEDAVDAKYAVVTPSGSRLGNDVITVGLFYRMDKLIPDGPAHTLDSPEFQQLSRQPLAQVFRVKGTEQKFLVAVNHLKSKGSCPDSGPDAAQRDGQGCWNPARTAAVEAQVPWLHKLAADAETGYILVMGDMNAWRLEDPVRKFREAGMIDLVEHLDGLPQHSFRYFGQAGTLDYAFASPQLAGRARSASIWHINADWPRNMDLPAPWLRMSDHDPVVIDLDFNQASTSN